MIGLGEPAPYFHVPALGGSPRYAFDSAAGRAILILFFGSAGQPQAAAALAAVQARRDLFDDEHACFFGVSVDPADAAEGRIAQQLPGIRFFLDYERNVSRLYGAEMGGSQYRPHWLLLDPMLRVMGIWPIEAATAALDALAAFARPLPLVETAPVLVAPAIFEPTLCRYLISLYEKEGGEESGFMREVDGKTVLVTDPQHKRRRDYTIADQQLQGQLALRIRRRLVPMIARAFQFEATRMERYIVACYDAEAGGHFRAHRDNTTKGTAHRRFAVTINLNAEEYEGGELRFPEYGRRTYRAPTGGAVVFSCSLLHEATPVTRGTRYAFLPFLYDDAAAKQREANNAFLDEGLGAYRA
ncbi:redoxin domain-containing protein [Sphingosinicella sp. BN140058]|nr:redoxin domain-containing protein [Sphingosinicella sp. BN140058]